MRGNSLRMRLLCSLALVMIPVVIFSVIIYIATRERSQQYVASMHLQNFTYAAENISTLIDRLKNASDTAFSLESEIELDESGHVTVPHESKLCAALGALESRMYPPVSVLFYVKGDRYIYSSEGKLLYGDYENEYCLDFDLTSSSFFSTLQRIDDGKLIPLLHYDSREPNGGLAYALPYPSASATKGVLIFVLSNNVVADEFHNYLGNLPGSLYLCDSAYNLLYEHAGLHPHPPAKQVLPLRGTGVLPVKIGDESLLLVRVVDSKQGLQWHLLCRGQDFYQAMFSSQRILLSLMLTLLVLLFCLILWIGFFNYKPIRDLFFHVTGSVLRIPARQNELDLIRTYYDHISEEVDALSARIDEIMPLVARRFIRQLVCGYIPNEEAFRRMASQADLSFPARWNVAMYFIFPRESDESMMERAASMLLHFALRSATLALIELYAENALCIILNFNTAQEEPNEQAESLARYLYDYLVQNRAAPDRVGIGSVCEDPLRLNESFAEANAAIQLAPPNAVIWRYGTPDNQPASGEDAADLCGLSQSSLSLLQEGMSHGDKNTALFALSTLLRHLSEASQSISFYRFHCSELAASLLRTAGNLSLPISSSGVQRLISVASPEQFSANATELVSDLCDRMKQRLDDEEERLRHTALDFILNNFRRNDLSIQTVADETGIRRMQLSSLIKEETGLGFVQYVSYLRINEFKRLLIQSDKTIRELVLQVGYTDVPNFLRKFKQLEGVTPSQYRQQRQ